MASKSHPPLMKKHSQTDLISRLKSRKILGVGGEDDDGEVHRSKISQMLGNELKFAVREPIGLRVWILISAVGFTLMALTALVFPNQLYELVFEEELSTTSISVRLYGAALLSKYQNVLNRKKDAKATRGPIMHGDCTCMAECFHVVGTQCFTIYLYKC
ncbi:tumor protein p53-inducible protein 11b [Fundulus heteroclitus]|uniref:tumor protein p53-inducible protein 11b n=1 Tax=Fundulus heteroclitus TaxID=8078 RepID=UPI00165B04F0|nr:tumor protein p53-inducible protein 11b [Fundulus heteroclitus]